MEDSGQGNKQTLGPNKKSSPALLPLSIPNPEVVCNYPTSLQSENKMWKATVPQEVTAHASRDIWVKFLDLPLPFSQK